MASAVKGIRVINQAQVAKGTVLEVDDNQLALVRLETGQHARVRADMLRGKSAAPKSGETWIFDQPYGSGWMFAVPMNYTGGDQDFSVPAVFTNSWHDAGAPYLPVGYIMDSEGWVTLRGRLTGGTVNQAAFTLPIGYRTGGTVPFRVPQGVNSAATVTIDITGAVTPSAVDVSLEQVRFLAGG